MPHMVKKTSQNPVAQTWSLPFSEGLVEPLLLNASCWLYPGLLKPIRECKAAVFALLREGTRFSQGRLPADLIQRLKYSLIFWF